MTLNDRRQAQAADRLSIEERRVFVAAQVRGGVSYRVIADKLGVSVGTIASDYKAILKEWRQQYAQKANDRIMLVLARLDKLLVGVWDKAAAGDLEAIDAALKIMDRQIRVMGLSNVPEVHVDSATVTHIKTIEVIKDYGGPADEPA